MPLPQTLRPLTLHPGETENIRQWKVNRSIIRCMLDDNLIQCNIKHQLKYIYSSHSTVQHFKIHQKHSLTFETQNCWFRCDVLEANDDKTETKSPALQPNENTLSGTVTTNGNPEKMEPEKGDDDPKKSSEASANKLEMFQEKQKFIEEQNRKRKEMLSKVNMKQE